MHSDVQRAGEASPPQHICPYYPLPGAALTGACEPQQVLRAIRAGEIDALIASLDGEERIFTLQGAETPYRMLVEQMQEGALTLASDGTILYANKCFAELVNVPLEQLMGARLETFVRFGVLARELIAEACAGPVRREFELRRDNGSVVPVYVAANRLPTAEGVPLCLIFTDLTEQKWVEELRATEAALRNRNESLALLAEVASELLRNPDPRRVMYELARRVMEFLDCQVFFNYLVEPRTGQLHLNACGGVPDYVSCRIEWLDRGAAVCGCVARDGRPIVAERIGEKWDPRTDLVRSLGIRAYACHPLQAGSRTIGTLSFGTRNRDRFSSDDLALMRVITDHIAIAMERVQSQQALRAAKERLESTLGSITDAFVAFDREWRFLEVNPVAEQAIFRQPAGLLLGKVFWDEYPAARDSEASRRFRAAMETGVPAHFEAQSRIVDRWFEIHAYPYEDRLEIYLRDITERKSFEFEREALLDSERAARGEAERANQLKDEFLANLSHELRTPLTAVLGWTQLLQRGRLNPQEQQEAYNIIERNSRLQSQLISDLLDMSRVLSGKLRLEMQRVELASVAEAALASVLPLAEEKGVRLERDLHPVGPVNGDPARLQQIIWNLLSNAVKFTPRDGCVRLHIAQTNGSVEVAVTDTGVGIKPEFLPHVFERFRQADGSTTRRQGGLGLGLSIVKQLTELHGGSIRADSPGEGAGATFTLRLPRTAREHAGSGRPAPAEALCCGVMDLSGVRVLLIDDDPVARDLISRMLGESQADVQTAGSGAEAMRLIDAGAADVILSDIGMPVQDGYQFVRELRRRPTEAGGTLPAIAVTAFARPEDRTRAILSGYQAHIAKPIDPAELVAMIASLTGRAGRLQVPAVPADDDDPPDS